MHMLFLLHLFPSLCSDVTGESGKNEMMEKRNILGCIRKL